MPYCSSPLSRNSAHRDQLLVPDAGTETPKHFPVPESLEAVVFSSMTEQFPGHRDHEDTQESGSSLSARIWCLVKNTQIHTQSRSATRPLIPSCHLLSCLVQEVLVGSISAQKPVFALWCQALGCPVPSCYSKQ